MDGLAKFIKFLRLKLRRKRSLSRVASFDLEGRDSYNYDKRFNGARFCWDHIERFTKNFAKVIGYGGFSTVYLAHGLFPGSSGTAAVKVQCGSELLNIAYKQELEILRHLNHPNIVKLLGYCDEREEGIIVFEYVPNGNLQERLHGSNSQLLSWKRRMAIAFQLAEAIDYLHHNCGLQIVHGDTKSSNVLLDKDLNCKLCDFGSSKMGFTSTILPSTSDSPITRRSRRRLLGSPGYTDPHYLRTGLATKKNDVYSFGVIILELITGIEAFKPSNGERLISKAEIMLLDVEKAVQMVDPRLKKHDLLVEEVKAMATLAARCLCDSPSLRPSTSDILTTMREKIPSVSVMIEKRKD